MDFALASIDVDPRKVGVMFSILLVSLFAVSFPTLSKFLPFLRIPTVVFFIGKHFGTGVILATAFIHLLDDAFRSLQSTKVEQNYPGLGKWTGFIILASLLSIFLVEYISTSYVEQLHDKPSAPPTPAASTPPSRSQSPGGKVSAILLTEDTPLLNDGGVHPLRRHTTDLLPHHRLSAEFSGVPVEVMHNSPRLCRLAIAHDHVHGHHHHEHPLREEYGLDADFQQHEDKTPHPRIGRRRQIIGILVLQLGIMIHSLVIGMTLAITSGSDFTSLTTAVIFHQLFEGLSLGIRIAALPNASPKHEVEEESEVDAVDEALRAYSDDVETGHSTSPERPLRPQPLYSLRARLADIHWFKPTLSFLFGVTTPFGMALGMVLWPNKRLGDGAKMLVVQGVMSAISAGMLIYAATVEMLAADFVFGDVEGGTHHHHQHGGHELEHDPHHHKRHHELHERTRRRDASAHASTCPPPPAPCWTSPGMGRGQQKRPTTPPDLLGEPSDSSQSGNSANGESGDHGKKASMAKRLLAVVSLLAGVGMMVLVGLGE